MQKLVMTVLALALTTTVVRADDGAPTPKSETTAFELSLGGTAASAALVLAGSETNNGDLMLFGLASSLVTPSLGQWYSGQPLTTGMAIRAASAVVTIAGLGEALGCSSDFSDTPHSCGNGPGYMMLGGLIGYAGGTIYDIATAGRAARDYNDAHGLRMRVSPTVMHTPSGASTMGVGIGGTF
jgi:hypothetical protein